VSDAVTAPRPTPALLGAILAAIVSLWAGFAVVAGVTGTSTRPTVSREPSRLEAAPAAPVGLALSAVPALRLRAAMLERSVAAPTATSAPATPPATSDPAATTPTPSTPPTSETPQTPSAVQPSPSPRPAPKPQPTLTAEPKHTSSPDFDESAPSGFDTSG
jgi:outer membrane biosynthesis protein TonB